MKLIPLTVISLKKVPIFLFCVLSLISFSVISLELGYGVGSMGIKYEAGHKLSQSFNARLGFSEFKYVTRDDIHSADVATSLDMLLSQDATLDIEQLSLLFDYHPWRGDFRFTGGVSKNKLLLELVNYGDGEFIINNYLFSDHWVDSTELTMQLTNGVSPYFGVGWSTGFDRKSGFSFSGDLGFYYAVDFALNFSAKCTENASRFQCAKIRSHALKQQRKLRDDSELLIMPMLGALVSYKF
jgi:hypothetical protein